MTMTELLLLLVFVLCAAGGIAAIVSPEKRNPLVIAVLGSFAAAGLIALGGALVLGGDGLHIPLWPVLSLSTLVLSGDHLSGLFLIAAGVVFLPVSVFSLRYLAKYREHRSLRYFSILYFWLLASVLLVLVAGDALSFLVGWEFMSIASYLLVTYDYEHEGPPKAAYVMLAMSEAGTIAAAVAFLLLAGHAGSLDFGVLRLQAGTLAESMRWAIFLLAFFGFAVKAGLIPVNSWLPLAHPVAPTNVSAILSAVIVNLGIYGIVRVNLDLAPVPGVVPGLIVLVVGSASALVGILYATIQPEMKRLLAYSTIENMGIVTAGVGAAMVFLATGHPVVAGIAAIAAFYHLLNHSTYKALLFIGTGAVEAAAGTRDLDRLGGLIRGMPWTSAFFLIGVLSISALPPLNGFVSEWLTLQTILRSALLASTVIKVIFAICGAMLALTAGLAVTCFAKVFAMGFLGMSRSEGAEAAQEAPVATRLPLAFLAACCIALGVLPSYVIPELDRVSAPLVHQSAAAALVPPFFLPEEARKEAVPAKFAAEFHDLGARTGKGLMPGRGLVVLHRGGEDNPVVFAMSTFYMAIVLGLLLLLTFAAFRLLAGRRRVSRGPAWDGGLRKLRAAITYTATGFSNPVRVIFDDILSPGTSEDDVEAVARHFRTAIVRHDRVVDVVDDLVVTAPVTALRALAGAIRKAHVGNVNAYAAYVLVTMLVVLIVGIALR
jgi:hydrogenase-4 component B